MSFDWKSLLKNIAPMIATAIPGVGPMAGAATKMLLDKLDPDKTVNPDDAKAVDVFMAKAILDPATQERIIAAEQAFQVQMAALGFKDDESIRQFQLESEKLATTDRANAREREIKTGDSWTPRILAALFVVGWFLVQGYLLQHVIPQEMREVIMRTLGTMDMALGLILGYYFGSSASSAKKDDHISRLTTAPPK